MPTPHVYRKYAHPFSEGSFSLVGDAWLKASSVHQHTLCQPPKMWALQVSKNGRTVKSIYSHNIFSSFATKKWHFNRKCTMVGAIFKFSPLSSLSWSNVPSNEVVSSSRRPITCKRRLHLFRRGLFYDDGPPPRHSWQCWHLQWTIWPLRSPSRSTLCLGQPEQDDQKSRHLPILNNSQLRTACSQVKTHISTMLSIRMVGVGRIMRSSENL